MAAKKFQSEKLLGLAKSLLNAQGNSMEQAARKYGINPIYNDDRTATVGYNWGEQVPTDDQILGIENLESKIAETQDLSQGVSFPQLGSLALGAAKEHPFKTAGLIGLGAGNLGGLTDNNRFGGQLGGLALGGLGSYLMGANPYTAAMLTMGGGQLGALFDKLRSKREQPQQYYGR